MSMIELISDYSHQNLIEVPKNVLEMSNLKMLFLEENFIETLPDDFFDKLKRITWLDLRKNKLQTIPTSIKDHEFLETLLLQNNEIEILPNEIGLVPNLKALQLSGNPISYPGRQVLDQGISSICSFLKRQHFRAEKEAGLEDDEELEIQVIEPTSKSRKKIKSKVSIKDLLRKSAQQYHWSDAQTPIIKVKSLNCIPTSNNSNEILTEVRSKNNLYGIRPTSSHVRTKPSKYYCWNPTSSSNNILNIKKENGNSVAENEMKQVCLEKLKELFVGQDKLLQQEKNLKALNRWRLAKKMEVPGCSRDFKLELPPYDTDPDCNRMLSRKDIIASKIDDMIKNNKMGSKKKSPKPERDDLQKLINDVVEQMKSMDCRTTDESMSSRTKQEVAGEQIKRILDLHKKIASLQTKNESF